MKYLIQGWRIGYQGHVLFEVKLYFDTNEEALSYAKSITIEGNGFTLFQIGK